MARIIVTASASTDQLAILNDLHARAGLRTAVRFRSLFGSLFDRLADFPLSGPLRPALGPTVRIGIVPPYIVIYVHSERDDAVTLLRIVHGRREITRRLLPDDR
jgi:plasmid stabilization system protein ParE